jgi:hypothetical protein
MHQRNENEGQSQCWVKTPPALLADHSIGRGTGMLAPLAFWRGVRPIAIAGGSLSGFGGSRPTHKLDRRQRNEEEFQIDFEPGADQTGVAPQKIPSGHQRRDPYARRGG